MNDTIANIKRQLLQLQELHASGALPAASYEESKALLERRLVDLVLNGKVAATASSRRLVAVLAAVVVVIAGAGYWWTGSPTQLGSTSNVATGDESGTTADNAPHGTNSDQVAAMVEKLSARLKDKPQDAEGWAMLARSYSVLGRHPEALLAYEKAIALRKDDANLLADYADSLAVKNDRNLASEPLKWIERALKLEPHNVKALSLAGSEAFERKDYKKAVQFWQQVVDFGPADNPMVQQVASSLTQARELAGLPAVEKKAETASPKVAATVSGTVTIASTLRSQANPDDTVFVFARAAEGSRMPLAILRKQVRDLPIQFTLDDSMSMSPAASLATAKKIIVGARISKSGNAQPQAGDISGQTGPVSVGATGLTLELSELIKP